VTHSWHPIDLAAIAVEPAKQPTTGGLIYPGGRHLLSGEPESGKSLLGLALLVTEVRAGNTVAWIDLESDESFLAERLRCFGVTADDLQRFAYFRPFDPIGTKGAAETIATFVAERRPSIVAFDAFAGLADLHGLDSWKTGDVERAYRLVLEPWRAEGAAILVVDHVVKAKGDRGRFAAGSERKLGAADVHIGLEVIDPFGRGRTGRAKVIIHKDRSGYLSRPRFGDFVLASDDEGIVTACALEAAPPEPDAFKPTTLMARVSEYLEKQREGVSRSRVKENVKGRAEWVAVAIDHLVADGYATEQPGNRGTKLLSHVRPYTPDPTPDPFPEQVGTRGNRSLGWKGTTPSPVPGVYTPEQGTGRTSLAPEQGRPETLAEESERLLTADERAALRAEIDRQTRERIDNRPKLTEEDRALFADDDMGGKA
jgi:hypothetical protein